MLKIEKERINIRHYLVCGFSIGRIEDFSSMPASVDANIKKSFLSDADSEMEILQRRLAGVINIYKYKPKELIDVVTQTFSSNEEARALIIIGYSYWFIWSALRIMKEMADINKFDSDTAFQNTLNRVTELLQNISPAVNDNVKDIINIMLSTDDYNEFTKKIYGFSERTSEEPEYDTFISYRRETGQYLALLVYDALKSLGFKPFLDIEALRVGKFNEQLYNIIDEASYFIIILTENALDRCVSESDWVRLEIERAISKNKLIVPVIDRNFKMPNDLPNTLKELPNLQAVIPSADLFKASMKKLANLLKPDGQ